jgi:hypothetical protein
MEDESESKAEGAPEPVSEDDWIIHSINIQGIFFERSCWKIIEDTRPWKINSTNLPVEFPPPTEHSRGKESNLDIRAEIRWQSGYDGGMRIFTLPIECKKNNPEFVKWLFFPKHATSGPARARVSGDRIILRRTGIWTDQKDSSKLIALPRFSPKYLDDKLTIVDEAREVRGSYRGYKDKNSKTRTANNAISEAAYQVALATQALFYSESQALTVSLQQASVAANSYEVIRKMPWVDQVFLPVVVTSARIFTCDFKPEDIDVASGEIPYSKAQIKEQQYVLYEYALPRHLQAVPDNSQIEEQENTELYSRMQIIVVHSRHFGSFLNGFAKDSDMLFR